MSSITVIIPTYNNSKYICQAIESVLAQTFNNFEIIVIDDGSTDNTRSLLNKFNSQIRYIYQNNQGPASARNNALKFVKSDYICFLDSDDLWSNDYLNKSFNYLLNNNLDLIITDYFVDYYDSNDKFLKREPKTRCDFIIDNNKQLYEQLFKRFQGGFDGTSAILMRKQRFEIIGKFDEKLKILEDWDLWLRIAKNNLKIGYLKEPLFVYRRHNNSLCRNKANTALKFNNIYYAFEKNKKDAFKINKSLKKNYSETLMMLGVDTILTRFNILFAIKCIWKSHFFLYYKEYIPKIKNFWCIFKQTNSRCESI